MLVWAANRKLTTHTQLEPSWCSYVEYGFVGVFIFECVVKILGVGLKGYLRTPWWTFDGIVAFAALVGVVLDHEREFTMLQSTSIPLRMAKVLRTIRLIRVVSRIKKFRQIISTSTKFFPVIPRFLLLLAVILYVYAIIGMECFGFPTQEEWDRATEGTAYSKMTYVTPAKGDVGSFTSKVSTRI